MTHNRILAVVLAAALVGGALFTAHVSGAVTPRDAILADLTEISCEVLTHEHTSATVFRADAALRSVVQDVALSSIVETPATFGRSTDQLVLSLAAEARDRFKSPPDRILVDTAVTTASVVAMLHAERTGADVREESWFFGPMRSWTITEGSAFDVALGVCPTVTPGDGATVTATSSDQRVLADTAFTADGATLRVQTAAYPDDGPTGATVTVTVTTKSGLGSIAEFVVSVLHVAGPPPTTAPAPPATEPPPPTTAPAPPATEPAPPTTQPAPPSLPPAVDDSSGSSGRGGRDDRDDDDDDDRSGDDQLRERLRRDLAFREEEAEFRILRFLARFTGALRW